MTQPATRNHPAARVWLTVLGLTKPETARHNECRSLASPASSVLMCSDTPRSVQEGEQGQVLRGRIDEVLSAAPPDVEGSTLQVETWTRLALEPY